MLSKRPHTLTFRWNSEPTIDEATGRPTEGGEDSITIQCRYQPNGTGKFVESEGGISLTYAYKVFSDVLPVIIPAGATTEIEGKLLTVIRHDNMQMHSRIWV